MSNVVILILVGAAMFAVLGGVTLLNHFYNLNNIKRQPLKIHFYLYNFRFNAKIE